jgi:hypothetical protein
MEITIQEYKKTNYNPIESKKVTLIWANDGWCYIPQLKLRQRFDTKYFFEEWDGVIALPEYVETVNWSLISLAPRSWREQGEGFDHIFEEKVSTQNKKKTMV